LDEYCIANNLKNLFLLAINIEKKNTLIFIINVKLIAIIINLNNMKIFKNKINNKDNGN